ncbi:MAG: hypothetical protein V2G41_09595 [bacterium JZ-2024 1]
MEEKQRIINAIAQAIAEFEGFFVSKSEARRKGIRYPTRAQRNANPGNVRAWHSADGKPYPVSGGYVDFYAWARAKNLEDKDAIREGWRVLKKLIENYINRGYSLREFFERYAPAVDNNDPQKYAEYVAIKSKLNIDKPVIDQCCSGAS